MNLNNYFTLEFGSRMMLKGKKNISLVSICNTLFELNGEETVKIFYNIYCRFFSKKILSFKFFQKWHHAAPPLVNKGSHEILSTFYNILLKL